MSVNYVLYLFLAKKYKKVTGKEIYSDTLESTPMLEKEKFPQDYFPEVRTIPWSIPEYEVWFWFARITWVATLGNVNKVRIQSWGFLVFVCRFLVTCNTYFKWLHGFTKFKWSSLYSRRSLWRTGTVMKRLVCAVKTKGIARSANCESVSGRRTPWQGETPLWMDSICIQRQQLCGCRAPGFCPYSEALLPALPARREKVVSQWYENTHNVKTYWGFPLTRPRTPFVRCSLTSGGALRVWRWRRRSCQSQRQKRSWGLSSTAPASATAQACTVFACSSLLWRLL